MSKVILSTLVAALVCVAGSAKAANGISSNTLGQMGLTGLTVMSDSDALAIRGLGFSGVDHSINSSCCGPRGSASPGTLVAGHSTATMNINAGMGDDCPTCTQTGSSHSENAYLAAGPYSASGSNYSEAGSTITKSEAVDGVGADREGAELVELRLRSDRIPVFGESLAEAVGAKVVELCDSARLRYQLIDHPSEGTKEPCLRQRRSRRSTRDQCRARR